MDHSLNILSGRFLHIAVGRTSIHLAKTLSSDSHPIHVSASIQCFLLAHFVSFSFHVRHVLRLSKVNYASGN